MTNENLDDLVKQIGPDLILGVRSDAFKKGYHLMSNYDAAFYYLLGQKYYDELMNACFEYSTLECEMRKIPIRDIRHHPVYDANLLNMWHAMYERLPQLEGMDMSTVEFTNFSETQMRNSIRKKITGELKCNNAGKDYLSK